jgi:hypothetical protein
MPGYGGQADDEQRQADNKLTDTDPGVGFTQLTQELTD